MNTPLLAALCALSLPFAVTAQSIVEITTPTVTGSYIDTGLLPPGPITLAALNAAGTPAGGTFAGITLTSSGAALGVLNTQAFKNGFGMDAASTGALEIIPVGGSFGAFNAQLDLTGPSTEIGFGVGDWVGPMGLDFYLGGVLQTSYATSTQTGVIIYYQMTGGTFDRVDVKSSAPTTGNWCFVDFFVQATTGLFASFTGTPTSGSSPLAVNFLDTSYSSAGGISAWQWDVDGDGTIDYTTQNCSHTYPAGGAYTVSLTVADPAFGTATETKTNYIEVDFVQASFTHSILACTTVQFVDTSVNNPTAWAWDVDSDGTVDYTTPAPQHTYPANGVYTCTLTVSNAWSTDTIAQEVNLGAGKLTTIFAQNNGGSVGGIVYYDLLVTNAVTISQFETNYDATVGSPVGLVVYTVPTTYLGNEQNAAAWTQVAIDNGLAVSAGIDNPSVITLQTPFTLQPGSYGIGLVAVGDGHRYTSNPSPNTYNDANLQITVGAAQNVPFTGTPFSIRGWNGSIVYVTGAGAVDYGQGSPSGVSGVNPPMMTTTVLPALGATAELEITQYDATAAGFVIAGFGRANNPTIFGTINVANIIPFGIVVSQPMPVGTPVKFQTTVPSNCSLAGAMINWQNINVIVGSPNFTSMSNGVEWTIN